VGKHDRTRAAIDAEPVRANIKWSDIEALFRHLGAEISEGRGSRVRVALNDIKAVFHRPHPSKETSKPTIESVRGFLERAGVT